MVVNPIGKNLTHEVAENGSGLCRQNAQQYAHRRLAQGSDLGLAMAVISAWSRRPWPLAGLTFALIVNVLWIVALGYALVRLL